MGVTVTRVASAGVEGKVGRVVEVMSGLGGSWRPLEDAFPLESFDLALPGPSRCRVVLNYGRVMNTGRRSSYRSVRPVDLRGWYLRVRSHHRGLGWVTRFRGQVPQVAFDVFGRANGAMGDEEVVAFGLEWLLDRYEVGSSFWWDGSEVQEVETVDVFNGARTTDRRLANRSGVTHGGTYVFERGGSLWSAADIVRYLLGRLVPGGGVSWVLGGAAVDALEGWYPRVDPDGKTALGVIQELVHRRRGTGARVFWGGGSVALLEVFSLSERDYKVDEFELPRNRSVVDLDLESGVKTQASVLVDELPRVDEVIVRGDPLRVGCTLWSEDGSLEEGWSGALASAYNNAGQSLNGYDGVGEAVQAKVSDDIRASQGETFWRPVYSYFRVPEGFAWEYSERVVLDPYVDYDASTAAVLYTPVTLPAANLLPLVLENGLVDTAQRQPVVRRIQRFARETVFFEDYDYSTDPPTFTGDADAPPRAMPLVVFALGPDVTEESVVIQRYYELSSPGRVDVPSATVSVVENDLGVYIEARPAKHSIARIEFEAGVTANPSQWEPVMDWRDFFVTVAIDTNQHVGARRRLSEDGRGRRVRIDVPGAALWWAAPGTVAGVREDGLPIRILSPSGLVTRDDRNVIWATLAMALAWYGRERVRASVSVRDVGGLPGVGTMLGRIDAGTGVRHGAYAPVTAVKIDWMQDVTSIETSHGELDFAGVAAGMLTARERDRGIYGGEGGAQSLAAVPVRNAKGFGGGSGAGGGDTVTRTAVTGFLGFLSEG